MICASLERGGGFAGVGGGNKVPKEEGRGRGEGRQARGGAMLDSW